MNSNPTSWGNQWTGYGEPITLATVALITGIASAVGGTGLSAGLALKAAADRRQKLRLVALRRKRKAIKERRAALEERRTEALAAIEQSRAEIQKARADAESRTPVVLYAGAAGLLVVTFIALRTAKRG
ncbi:hypothetical protein CMI37_07485 [Candidatus Pacearchaeota archaeon]|jgi:hypothetical protein|nr:hypothetical protein [Candidatus Pacearchaeota archaeon]|tara:strand:- start:777 stop:1163 length:387 start_codon:yes stop_codon:yes gene_type:complete